MLSKLYKFLFGTGNLRLKTAASLAALICTWQGGQGSLPCSSQRLGMPIPYIGTKLGIADGGSMAKPAVDRQPSLAQDSLGAARVLSVAPVHYLRTVRKLLRTYQRVSGVKQQHIFVTMVHAFMQELCGYPPTSYLVTSAASSPTAVGSAPHVVPLSYAANLTLFYFTASEHLDDVHDLWVRHAQVYLATYDKGDMAAECATTVVFTNFFVIDGAHKDRKTSAWHLWSVSDIETAQGTRVDLRILENEMALAPTMSQVIHKRLQALQYQSPCDGQKADPDKSEAFARLTHRMSMEGHGA
jgi:hypothetical protein